MKARIYEPGGDGHGIILSGIVIGFFMGTKEWNLTLKGSNTAAENEKMYDLIKRENKQGPDVELKPCYRVDGPKTSAIIQRNGTTWIGFHNETGYRVQIYKEEEI